MSAGASRWVILLWGIAPAVVGFLSGLGIGASLHGKYDHALAFFFIAAVIALLRRIWR